MMAQQLEPSEPEQRHEIPDVEAVSRGIEAAVERNRRARLFLQFRPVGAIGNQSPPFEFFQNVHDLQDLSRLRSGFTRGNCRGPASLPAGSGGILPPVEALRAGMPGEPAAKMAALRPKR